MHTYAEEMSCHLGNFEEYFALRVAIADRERQLSRKGQAQKRAAAVESVERLRIGDVIRVPHGRRAGLAVVLDNGGAGFGEPRPLVLTEDRWAGRISSGDFGEPVEPLTRVRVPKHFNHRSPQERRDLASLLRDAAGQVDGHRRSRRRHSEADDDSELARLRERMRRHPCHACPDREEHARWAERRWRLVRENEVLQDKVTSRTGSLTRTFDRVCTMLTERGYLASGGTVTPNGRMLARIWTEADLLVAECLRQGVWERLEAAELAAAVSVVLYESRRETEERASVPRGGLAEAVDDTLKLWAELESAEAALGLQLTREPDLGFVWPVYRWARGEALSKVLGSAHGIEGDMPAGDFVRWARQVVDLLGQIAQAEGASEDIRKTARQAVAAVNHGVLAYSAMG
jgi:ATP-dependent RNA helicase HelY